MSKQKIILVVEDEPDISAYIEILFQDAGYDTILAFNGKEGYELAKAHKPDLITLDITMPEQSGLGAYHQCKNDPELKNIPVVVLTATNDSVDSFNEGLKDVPGPEGFLTKPIDPEALIEMISTLLKKEKNF